MARLTEANVAEARTIMARYPRKRSATIPLLHLSQRQDGYLTDEGIEHVAELVEAEPAEIAGVASFYEMFKRHHVGKYLINICTNISCQLMGAEELMEHAEKTLGIKAGATTADGLFTLEEAECQAACTEAPCLQVNYRYRYKVTNEDFDELVHLLRTEKLIDEVPPHGTLSRIAQEIPEGRAKGVVPPEEAGAPA